MTSEGERLHQSHKDAALGGIESKADNSEATVVLDGLGDVIAKYGANAPFPYPSGVDAWTPEPLLPGMVSSGEGVDLRCEALKAASLVVLPSSNEERVALETLKIAEKFLRWLKADGEEPS